MARRRPVTVATQCKRQRKTKPLIDPSGGHTSHIVCDVATSRRAGPYRLRYSRMTRVRANVICKDRLKYVSMWLNRRKRDKNRPGSARKFRLSAAEA